MASAALGITFITTSQSNKETTANDALQRLEDATQETVTVDLTGLTTYTFTATEWKANWLLIGENNSALVTFTLPATKRMFAIQNNSAYDFDLTFNGSTVVETVPPGGMWIVYSTGTALEVMVKQPNILVKDDTGTSYTYAIGDEYVRHNNASAISATVPLNATVPFPIGYIITLFQKGAGQVTVVATGGVTINTPETLLLRTQYSTASLVKVGTNEWDLTGDLEAV